MSRKPLTVEDGSTFYNTSDSQLYKTNNYSGTDADINDTEKFTSDIDLTSFNAITIDIKFLSSGTTDDLTVNIYHRRDSSWDGDEIAVNSIIISNDGTEDIKTLSFGLFNGHGLGHYRLGLASSGSTDTFDVDIQSRKAKV